jgi:enoyl-[acyl-carrier protein] reductase II
VTLTPRLERLFARGKEFLGVEVPIMCGAMTWISEANLVARMSNLGAFGSLAAGNMPPDLFEAEVRKTQELTDRPFAANLITIAPNYLAHLEILCTARLSHIVFAGSIPRRTEVETAKSSGAKVLCFASNPSIARRMLDYGADGLILEGSEAGGHIGHVSTAVLCRTCSSSSPTGADLRRRRHRPRRHDRPPRPDGGGRRPARHPLRGGRGVPRPPALQGGLHQGPLARGDRHAPVQQQAAGRRRAGAEQRRDGRLRPLQLALLRKLEAGEINRQDAQYEVEHFWVGSLRQGAVEGDVDGVR